MKKKNQKKNNNKNKKTMYITAITLSLIVCIFGMIFFTINNKGNEVEEKDETEIAYTDLIKKIDSGEVEKIEMTVGSTSIKIKLKGEEESEIDELDINNISRQPIKELMKG